MLTMVPSGHPPADLPVCVALHGRGGTAHSMADAGLPQFLTAANRAAGHGFAFVAVDGGDTYWVGAPGDDPQAMLLGELPGWLARLGLGADGGRPRAALGISMGCYGALVYARRRAAGGTGSGGAPAAIATISPALFRDWGEAAARRAFTGERQWQDTEPLRHVAELPMATALGVWCGLEDPFYAAAADLAGLAHPAVTAFDHGAHEQSYWSRVLPDAIGFLAPRPVPRPAARAAGH